MIRPRVAVMVAGAGLALSTHAWSQPCAGGWTDRFTTAVLGPYAGSTYVNVGAQAVYDDGSGPALYIAGSFRTAGSSVVNSIARWDGKGFTALGSGLNAPPPNSGWVNGLAVFDPDGEGPAKSLLIAGGAFRNAGGVEVRDLAAWDGVAWHEIPGVPILGPYGEAVITMLRVADLNGTGTRLYVVFSYLPDPLFGNSTALYAWDGETWTECAQYGLGVTNALEAFVPTRTGAVAPNMYSVLSYSNSIHCSSDWSSTLTRLTPTGWEVVARGSCYAYCGTPPQCSGPFVYGVAPLDLDGPGPATSLLVVRGGISQINGASAHNLAAYDGVEWSSFGGGADGVQNMFSLIDPVTQRPSLYVTGENMTVGGVNALALAKFDSTGWTALPYGMSGAPSSMVPFTTPGSLPAIYMGGVRNTGVDAPGWARLTQYGWAPIGQCLNNQVHALAAYAPPSEPESLYAGGTFTTAAGQRAVSLARWDGERWWPAVNFNNHVDCLARFGSYLAVGGKFTLGGLATGGVALYDGQSLIQLGSGMNTPVHALCGFNGQLYAGGTFTQAGGTAAVGIARWNGTAWSAVGSGMNNHVDALAVFDDGAGPALYAAGKFTAAGGVSASRIARWNGSAWAALPGGGVDGDIAALTVMNDGSGPALYAGGAFTHAGSVAANRVARYRGGSWSWLRAGVDGMVRSLAPLDADGPGGAPPVLVVGGDFLLADGVPVSRAALWNGAMWEPLGEGMANGSVMALAAFGEGSVFAGGSFTQAGGEPAAFMAEWKRCACYANCDGSTNTPVLNINDYVCFQQRFAAADPYANCDQSTLAPTLNVADFICFMNRYAAGCP